METRSKCGRHARRFVHRNCGCILSCYLICASASELWRTRGFSSLRRAVLESWWSTHCKATGPLLRRCGSIIIHVS